MNILYMAFPSVDNYTSCGKVFALRQSYYEAGAGKAVGLPLKAKLNR